jgi:hypothetical protein
MNKDLQNGLTCSQFEALLAEALDDQGQSLPATTREAFEAHRQSCQNCASLFAEAREGMLLLETLQEVEPPRNLVHNILAATSRAEAGAATAAQAAKAGWWERFTRTLRLPRLGFLHSRFVTSFCMAFFSLSLTLSLAGVKLSDLARVDWHPSALRKSVVLQYTQIEARVMRYYDNMRVVYVVESLGQQLKKAAAPAQNDNTPNKDNTRPDQQNRMVVPGTGRPEEEENYSQERDGSALEEARSFPAAHELADPTMRNQGVQL